MTSGGHDYSLFKLVNLRTSQYKHPPPVLTSGCWLLKDRAWASGQYTSYWNAFLFSCMKEIFPQASQYFRHAEYKTIIQFGMYCDVKKCFVNHFAPKWTIFGVYTCNFRTLKKQTAKRRYLMSLQPAEPYDFQHQMPRPINKSFINNV